MEVVLHQGLEVIGVLLVVIPNEKTSDKVIGAESGHSHILRVEAYLWGKTTLFFFHCFSLFGFAGMACPKKFGKQLPLIESLQLSTLCV